MSAAFIVIALLAGAALAWVVAGARAKARAAGAEGREVELRSQLQAATGEIRSLNERLTESEKSKTAAETLAGEAAKNLAAQKALLEEAKTKLSETFRSLAADALAGNNAGFLTLAEEKFKALKDEAAGNLGALLQPLHETLVTYQRETAELERRWLGEIGTVGEQLRSVAQAEANLRSETAKLVNALQSHRVRGRWGEVTLRRTAELAGMSAHCDFAEQEQSATEDGRLRPDMTVKLPAGRTIVIDSKAPLDAFLDAMDATTDAQREAALARYAEQVRAHVTLLASKEYWAQFPAAPEFVVLFIPNDSFLGAAAEKDRGLIEWALGRRIVFATPTTLFALLFAIERGWRQEQLAENAQKISELGKELYDRMAILVEHVGKVGTSLKQAVESYNAAIGTLEHRVFPSARRFKELGAGGKKDFEDLPLIEETVRALPSPEAGETG
ncbi:MAG TPA: DNA recombination protein RmuC [Bryobacterales bacterium]|nr:DNA recombination protein RmuC [Bryobacterales bacterium]